MTKTQAPEIALMVCLSTAHITKSTRDLLQDYVEDNCHRIKAPITYEKGVYGYFVVISEIDPGWPHDLVQILTWAKNQGCTWLMLDCDGPEMPELPVYDW